jgi:hypothetical protein
MADSLQAAPQVMAAKMVAMAVTAAMVATPVLRR